MRSLGQRANASPSLPSRPGQLSSSKAPLHFKTMTHREATTTLTTMFTLLLVHGGDPESPKLCRVPNASPAAAHNSTLLSRVLIYPSRQRRNDVSGLENVANDSSTTAKRGSVFPSTRATPLRGNDFGCAKHLRRADPSAVTRLGLFDEGHDEPSISCFCVTGRALRLHGKRGAATVVCIPRKLSSSSVGKAACHSRRVQSQHQPPRYGEMGASSLHISALRADCHPRCGYLRPPREV